MKFWLPLLGLSALFFLNGCDSSSNTNNIGETGETEDNKAIFVNPDIGVTDFHSIAIKTDPWTPVPSYPETSVVYYRWYLSEIEPTEGDYQFTIIQDVLDNAQAANKKLVTRFMLLDPDQSNFGLPDWLLTKFGLTTPVSGDDIVALYQNSEFQQYVEDYIQALGNQFNSSDALLRVDIGLVGAWGEWNFSGITDNPNLYINYPTDNAQSLTPYIDMVNAAFPNKGKVMTLTSSGDDLTAYATQQGMGWRADCLGDWQGEWNHMEHGYPEAIEHMQQVDNNFKNNWKQAPVDLEICGGPMTNWLSIYSDEQVEQTFQYALEQHASLLNLVSQPIPERYQAIIDKTLLKLGYRFQLNSVLVTLNSVSQSLNVQSQWQNIGVAPSYIPYELTWRLVSAEQSDLIYYFTSNQDISNNWQPAETLQQDAPLITTFDDFNLTGIAAGQYYLQVGFVDPDGEREEAKILFDSDFMPSDGRWYQIQTLDIN